jgi:predicted nucleotidyltransferase component of viral defense system
MDDLINQEKFEIEILDKLNSGRFLPSMAFCGGTMLRLCHGLDRFSVDLDFHLLPKVPDKELFVSIRKFLGENYRIKDSANKFHTLLYEIGSERYRRGLKIEIRKTDLLLHMEQIIAYSIYSKKQVFLNTVTMEDMMLVKIEAFLGRGEIRDAFDIEFLLKKGVELKTNEEKAKKIEDKLNELTGNDFKVKLFPLIGVENRQYYLKNGFRILRSELDRLKSLS